jgi:hypothetical protein
MRNVSNATAAPAADGNYQEINSGSGVGTTIQFNNAPVGQDDAIIVEFGMDMAGDIAISGNLDALYGSILKLAEDVKDLGPYSISRYISANPSQTERRAFGDSVLAALARISALENNVGTFTLTPNFSGSNGSATITGQVNNYVKSGKHVFFSSFFIVTKSSASGSFGVSGLPFISPYNPVTPNVYLNDGALNGTPNAVLMAQIQGFALGFVKVSIASYGPTSLSDSDLPASRQFIVSGSYITT